MIQTIVHALLRSAPENNIWLDYPAFVLPKEDYHWVGTYQIEHHLVNNTYKLHISYFLNRLPPYNYSPPYAQIRVDKTYVLYKDNYTSTSIQQVLHRIDPTDIETEMRIKEVQMMVGIA